MRYFVFIYHMGFRDEKKEALINIAMIYLSGVRDYRLSPRG